MIKMFTKKRRKGFTLIELIVVIAILGILAAVAIPRFMGATEKAKQSAHDANVAMIENAVELALANGVAATDITNIDWLVTNDYLSNNPTLPDLPGFTKTTEYDLTVTAGSPGDGGTTYTITVTPGKGVYTD